MCFDIGTGRELKLSVYGESGKNWFWANIWKMRRDKLGKGDRGGRWQPQKRTLQAQKAAWAWGLWTGQCHSAQGRNGWAGPMEDEEVTRDQTWGALKTVLMTWAKRNEKALTGFKVGRIWPIQTRILKWSFQLLWGERVREPRKDVGVHSGGNCIYSRQERWI
jgi:hypothetical protein